MRCPKCGGSGISCESGSVLCTRCNGIGDCPVTNFERITQSVDSMAEFLAVDEYPCQVCPHDCSEDECYLDTLESRIKAWKTWLEQESEE